MAKAAFVYALVAASAGLFACAAFTGTDVTDGRNDGGGPTSSGVPTTSDAGDGHTTIDGGSTSGGPYGTSTCSMAPGSTVFCADFDESPPVDAGWRNQSGSGLTLTNTFAGGSAPNALLLTIPNGGTAIAATRIVPLAPAAGKHFVVQFSFVASYVPGGASGLMTIANLGFEPKESTQIALLGTGHLTCGNLDVPLGAGVHKLVLTIAVDASGQAQSFTCAVDNVSGDGGTIIAPGASGFDMVFGTAGSTGMSTLSVDDVVFHVVP